MRDAAGAQRPPEWAVLPIEGWNIAAGEDEVWGGGAAIILQKDQTPHILRFTRHRSQPARTHVTIHIEPHLPGESLRRE
jgi:hypothetical protein